MAANLPTLPAGRSFDQLWEDLELVPEGYIGEIVDGQIIVAPRPDAPHATAASDLGGLLIARFRFRIGGPGGWVILHEPRIRFGDELRIPDLAAWRAARYVRPEKGPFVVMPDWVCEVLSPGTGRKDRTKKLPLYAKHGIAHIWLIDPIEQTLEVYRLQGETWGLVRTFGADDQARVEPFDAVELDLAMLWGPELPGEEVDKPQGP